MCQALLRRRDICGCTTSSVPYMKWVTKFDMCKLALMAQRAMMSQNPSLKTSLPFPSCSETVSQKRGINRASHRITVVVPSLSDGPTDMRYIMHHFFTHTIRIRRNKYLLPPRSTPVPSPSNPWTPRRRCMYLSPRLLSWQTWDTVRPSNVKEHSSMV